MFCLIKPEVEKFIQALKDGTIEPGKLASMSSQERRTFLSNVVGEANAKQVNALFESKLLLKNQQDGMITWAKQVAGLKPEVRRDLIAKIEKMDKVLDPKEHDLFLEDLAGKRLGVEVTFEEAKNISDMSKALSEAKMNIDPNSPLASPERMAYGRALVKLNKYITSLKDIKSDTFLQTFKEAPGKESLKKVSDLGGLAKSMKASLDNSVIGRQGLKTLFSNPSIWRKNAIKTYEDMYNTFGGKATTDEVMAEVLSRPNAINGLYKKEKLAIGNLEEAFPTSLPERIPAFGRAFKASQAAFEGFQYRTRADVFDKYVEVAQKTGADIQGIGKVANALTGRGELGKLEPIASTLNNLLFSPRFLKSNIDLLTVHAFDRGIGTFARKQAAGNLLKAIGGIGTVLTIANAVNPGSVDWDPRSSNFGKIKIGATRFDVSGGMASLITLVARLATMTTKSSTNGKITSLNSGKYGSSTGLDVFINFMSGKLAPLPGVIRDWMKGKDFNGKKPTLASTAINLMSPLSFTTYQELESNPNSAPTLWSMILDGHGIGANTY